MKFDVTFRNAAGRGGGAVIIGSDATAKDLARLMASPHGAGAYVKRWKGANGNAVYFAPGDVVCFEVKE